MRITKFTRLSGTTGPTSLLGRPMTSPATSNRLVSKFEKSRKCHLQWLWVEFEWCGVLPDPPIGEIFVFISQKLPQQASNFKFYHKVALPRHQKPFKCNCARQRGADAVISNTASYTVASVSPQVNTGGGKSIGDKPNKP